jgi:prepilin-type N-terminal cleavage/methylation domain-containing protein
MNTSLRENGFTLLEIIAVLVILSILAAVAVPKYVSLDESARQRGIDAAVSELNGRETLTWSNAKISISGWVSDERTFELINPYLGEEYDWATEDPKTSGGTLSFKNSVAIPLTRSESTKDRPGSWSR